MIYKNIIAVFLLLIAAGTVTAQNKRKMEITIQSSIVNGKEILDTVIKINDVVKTNLKAKNVVGEASANGIDTIQIVNFMRRLTIKPSKDNKVRIATTVYYDESKPILADEVYIKQANIVQVKNKNVLQLQIGSTAQFRGKNFPWKNMIIGNEAIINSKGDHYSTTARASSTTSSAYSNTQTTTTTSTSTVTSDIKNVNMDIVASAGSSRTIMKVDSSKRIVMQIVDAATTTEDDDEFINRLQVNDIELELPANKSIVIKSKYGNIIVNGNKNNFDFDLISASLELPDVETVKIKSEFSNISASNIKSGDLEVKSGSLNIRDAGTLGLKADFANVNIKSVDKITGRGNSSNFDIITAGLTELEQSFGTLRVTNLKNDLKLKAANTEVKIFNLASTIKNIDITNKFATINIPLQNMNNYKLETSGTYSSLIGMADIIEERVNNEKIYKKTTGSGNLNIRITCPHCTTDFR